MSGSQPLSAEQWDARAGGRLRAALVYLPAGIFCFGYVFFLLVMTLVMPHTTRRYRHKLVAVWGRTLLWILGIRLDVQGAERLSEPGPAIVMFNHQSLLDLMLLTSIWPANATVLYKQEFHRIPLFGATMLRLGMIPVDRRNREAAIGSLTAAGHKLVEEGTKVFIAPEGTRSRTDGLLPFKRGPFHLAIETGMPALPVVFRGVRALWPQGSLLARPGVARIDVLPPVDTSGWTSQTPDEHLAAMRALYLSLVPASTTGANPRRRRRASEARRTSSDSA